MSFQPPSIRWLRWVLVAIAGCTLLVALDHKPGARVPPVHEWLIGLLSCFGGPVLGAVAQRCRGGIGIKGGVIGGVVSYVGFAVVMYLRACLYPRPDAVGYIGPVLGLLVFAFFGAAIGLVVGILVSE